jgi:hypothetical protein
MHSVPTPGLQLDLLPASRHDTPDRPFRRGADNQVHDRTAARDGGHWRFRSGNPLQHGTDVAGHSWVQFWEQVPVPGSTADHKM